jgi:hypothetical protein
MGGIKLAKAASWPYDDRPAIAAERAGLEYGTFSALRLFVLLLYLSPEDRCAPAGIRSPRGIVHDWHPLATADKLPCRGEVLHSCSPARLQVMSWKALMVHEQEDPMPCRLHSCSLGPRNAAAVVAPMEVRSN